MGFGTSVVAMVLCLLASLVVGWPFEFVGHSVRDVLRQFVAVPVLILQVFLFLRMFRSGSKRALNAQRTVCCVMVTIAIVYGAAEFAELPNQEDIWKDQTFRLFVGFNALATMFVVLGFCCSFFLLLLPRTSAFVSSRSARAPG
ncbi:MAG: hypothetical protein JKY94_01450 [Rhodobacteraceae bacterium]|nr:hypothetical protein [Paracoccaceae bacterium]